jgi:cytochrome c
MRAILGFLGVVLCASNVLAGPVHDSAKTGDLKGVEDALNSGVPVDESDGRATALYYAVTKAHPDVVRLLVSRGADVNRDTKWGPPIINAAWNCNSDIMKLLLEKGADANAALNTDTALHMAAQRGHRDCVMLLVEAGADVNALNRFREPPIHLAKKEGAEDVVRYLLDHGYVFPKPPAITSRLAIANPDRGEAIFTRECRRCHDASDEQKSFRGPPLWNLLGRDIASVEGFPYSGVLKEQPGEWSYEKLNLFLSDPTRTLPGTDMGSNGVQDESQRADLIMFLRQRGNKPYPLP